MARVAPRPSFTASARRPTAGGGVPRTFAAGWLVLGALLAGACSRAAPGGEDPLSVLVVTFDTTRADRFGCYGHPGGLTPTVDGLAARGLRVEQAFSTAPLTLPAHASLWTGQIPPRHGVRDNGSFRLGEEARTLAEILAQAGLRTAAFVGAYVLDSRYGLAQGFEHYDDQLHRGEPVAIRAADRVGFYEERAGRQVTDSALAWLGELDADERFFAWVHYFDPHFPYAAPEAFAAPGRTDYEAELAAVDAELARLVGFLGEAGRLDSTLIVVTADHGEALGEHEEVTHGRLVHDATMRVPLLFSNPRLFPAPRVVDEGVASLVDVAPTVLGALGLFAPEGLDGVDLRAVAPGPDRAVYLETLGGHLRSGWAPLFALRRADLKYVLAPTPEFYDLRADPDELANLGRADPRAAGLARELESVLDSTQALPESVAPVSDADRERMAALGYADDVRDAAGDDGLLPDPKERMAAFRRLMYARSLLAEERREEALAELRELLDEEPANANAWETAFNAYTDLGRWAEAEAAARQMARWRPTAEAFVSLARVLHRNGRVEEFRAALERAEELDPSEGGIYVARGNHLAQLGQFERALREFERAIEVDPVGAGVVARRQAAAVRRRMSGAR